MPDFTIHPDPALWHPVPGPEGRQRFVAERTGAVAEESRDIARDVAELAVTVSGAGDGVTLLLQEPQTGLHAVARFSMHAHQVAPDSEDAATQMVTQGDPGPWKPTVVPVELGDVRGFRVSELLPLPRAHEGDGTESDLTVLTATRTTYVASVEGLLARVDLSPAPLPAAGVVLALVEPVIATWAVQQ